jgi:steroid delta-isomerase-like uncharacterized protein
MQLPAELPAEIRDFGERWLAAWGSRSPDRIVALCTEEVLWEDPALDTPLRGRVAVRTLLAETFRAFPDLEFTLVEAPCLSPDGTLAAVAWKVSGTMLGPLDPPGFGPTGRRLELEGVDLYDFRDGLISRMRTRYDVLEWLRQMGAAPPRGGRVERMLMRAQRLLARARRARS